MSELDQLAERVAALEAQLTELAGLAGDSGSISPNYLTTDALGRVGANFAGHIHAAGVDLLAGTTGTPPDDRRVRWLRESDGTPVADLFAYETDRAGLVLETERVQPKATAVLSAQSTADAAALQVNADDASPNDAGVSAVTAVGVRTIFSGAGKSSFVQLAVAAAVKVFTPLSVDVTVPATGVASTTITVPDIQAALAGVVLGALKGPNAHFATWGYEITGPDTVTLNFYNPAIGANVLTWVGVALLTP